MSLAAVVRKGKDNVSANTAEAREASDRRRPWNLYGMCRLRLLVYAFLLVGPRCLGVVGGLFVLASNLWLAHGENCLALGTPAQQATRLSGA